MVLIIPPLTLSDMDFNTPKMPNKMATPAKIQAQNAPEVKLRMAATRAMIEVLLIRSEVGLLI